MINEETILKGSLSNNGSLSGTLYSPKTISSGGVQLSHTSDYEKLINKPQINSVTLIKNKTSANLGLQDAMDRITNSDIDAMIALFVG